MNQKPHAAMLFAAGFGTRMGALTAHRPKSLIEVAGTPLIDHAMALVRAVNLTTIVANTHYCADQIADHLHQSDVVLSPEHPDILETGGGLKAALPLLGQGPVFTVNTDAVWHGPNPLNLLLDAWRPDKMDGLLMCVPTDRAIGHSGAGDFAIDAAGRITRGAGFVYGGVQIIKTDQLADIGQRVFSLNLLWDRMLEKNRLFALNYPGKWCDVGHPAGIGLAEDMLSEQHV